MVTMKEIAEKCNVSIATVSKALNHASDIGEETATKVKETAQSMGYFPNSAARSLKTNRSYNIGVLFVDKTRSGLTHEYFSQVLNSLKEVAEDKGYDITFISSHMGESGMSYLEHCKYRRCDGVVIASVDFTNPMVTELANSNVPVVTIDHVFDNTTAIISDNIQSIRDLVTYIYNRGHRKIAYIHGEDTSVTRNRLASFYRTCENLGVDVPDEYVCKALYHEPHESSIATKKLLSLNNRPTCIIYPDDFSYIGGMNELEHWGLKVPEDISVAGYDGIYLSSVMKPHLTTLKQDTEMLGKKAAEKLIEAIESPKTYIPKQIVIKGKVIEGETIKEI